MLLCLPPAHVQPHLRDHRLRNPDVDAVNLSQVYVGLLGQLLRIVVPDDRGDLLRRARPLLRGLQIFVRPELLIGLF